VSTTILQVDPDDEDAEDGAAADVDAQRKGKCVVLKTSTRQTVFLPVTPPPLLTHVYIAITITPATSVSSFPLPRACAKGPAVFLCEVSGADLASQ